MSEMMVGGPLDPDDEREDVYDKKPDLPRDPNDTRDPGDAETPPPDYR